MIDRARPERVRGGAVAQVTVTHGDIGIDGSGLHLIVGVDSFGERVDIAGSAQPEAGSVADYRPANHSKRMPIEGSDGPVDPKTDDVAAIGGAKNGDDQIRPGRKTPGGKGLPEVFRRDVNET